MPQYEDVYEPPVMDATFAEKIDELKEVLAPPIPDFVSDAFSVSRAYAVGEYCIYENHFYKFTSAKSAGAWDSTKVQETTLAAEQSSTNSNLANKTTWKLHNSATGQASISLSGLEYDELLIVVEISGSNKGVVNIPKINLTSSNSWFRTGGYGGNSGYMAYYAVRVTTADVALNNATLAGTDYTSTAVTKVYYR